MSWRVAKSLLHLREQVDHLFPSRNKENDGTIGDAAHASRTSDHNPWVDDGVVTAMDITHDPAHGFDSYKFAEELRQSRDKRIKYVISNRRIFSSQVGAWVWRPYNGSNPHDHHVHISVLPYKSAYDDVADWHTPILGNQASLPPVVHPDATAGFYEHITATEFGGPGDFNKSAYDNHVISNTELGVALPYKFEGNRPQVRVHGPKGSAVGDIVDIGPWNVNDPYWKIGSRPQAESGTDHTGRTTNHAGIDLTPALARKVGVVGKGLVNWEFVKKEVTQPVIPVKTEHVALAAPVVTAAVVASSHPHWPWVLGVGLVCSAIVGLVIWYRKKHNVAIVQG